MFAARRSTSASSAPHTTVLAMLVGTTRIASDRLARRVHARRDLGERLGRRERDVELGGVRAARRGVRVGPNPPMMIGGPGCCTGFGSAGESSIA